jgi:hypothetical protein
VPALFLAESSADDTSRRAFKASLCLPSSGLRSADGSVSLSESLQPPAKMGQHSIGADNHTWVLRDAFVDDHSRIDRSVVSKAQG